MRDNTNISGGNRTGGIIDAISQLAPLFIGSGKRTTKQGGSTTTATKGANPAAIDSLVKLLGSNAANPNAAKDMVSAAQKNAIQLMLQQGVPQIGAAERGTGIYNSSATAQAMSQLEGQTAAAVAKLELDQVNKAAETRTQAATSLGNMTGTVKEKTSGTTSTTKEAPAIDPVMAALGLGGMFLGNSLLKGKNPLTQLFGGDNPVQASPDFTPTIRQPNLGSSLDFAGFTKSFATDIAGALKNSTPTVIDPNTGLPGQQTGGGDDFVKAITDVGTSALFGGVTDFISGLFSGGDSGQAGGGDPGGGSWCFITTAVCTYMGKPDDCYELQVLRKFRDDYMLSMPATAKLVQQYYKEAPAIVEAIGTYSDDVQASIYLNFYDNYIMPAIDNILEGDNDLAMLRYTELFNIAQSLTSVEA